MQNNFTLIFRGDIVTQKMHKNTTTQYQKCVHKTQTSSLEVDRGTYPLGLTR